MNPEPRLPLTALVAALQGHESRRAATLAAPLVAHCLGRTVRRCERLVGSVCGNLGVDGEDIAMEAWERVLRRIATGSLVVTDELHFERLLMRVARHCFLDHLERNRRFPLPIPLPTTQIHDSPTAMGVRNSAEADLLLGANSEHLRWVERLFRWPDHRWALIEPRPLRRAPRVYRALVLFHLGEMVRGDTSETQSGLVRRFARLLDIPDQLWEPIYDTAVAPGTDETTLLAAVNDVCGTQIADRATLSVLRYEFARAVEGKQPAIPRVDAL